LFDASPGQLGPPVPQPPAGWLLDALTQLARSHGFALDGAQARVIRSLQRLSDELAPRGPQRVWERLTQRRRPVSGVYLWGPVGRGKSFLMDEFFRLAPVAHKERIHWHRFMQRVHHGLRALQGTPDPLKHFARQVGRRLRLLCLDEFHVTDIGDAMLMRGLLEGLFERGVVLVTTSNQHPDELYAHGLQRAQFLPAIELIKAQMEVLELDGGSDYRLRALTRAGVYHHPWDAAARSALEEAFLAVAGEAGEVGTQIDIDGRALAALRIAGGTAWFDFGPLCEGPRGTADYIELAQRYHTVLVSGVPQFRTDQAESMRRFTWLVDEFYDRQVKLILAAEVPAETLHACVPAKADSERTRSRLIEMQTTQYLSLPHLG